MRRNDFTGNDRSDSFMLDILVLTHSWLRWVVLAGGSYTAFRCLRSWLWKLPWKGEDNYFVWAFGRAFLYR